MSKLLAQTASERKKFLMRLSSLPEDTGQTMKIFALVFFNSVRFSRTTFTAPVSSWSSGFATESKCFRYATRGCCASTLPNYIIAGPAITVMRSLVSDRLSSFYRQLIEIPIKELVKARVGAFLGASFAVARVRRLPYENSGL